MLKLGDATIRGISASVLSILSNNLEIVQQMFSYGAIKPILLLCDHSTTSEPELLAGMGCVVQLTRIPEIGAKVVKQGAIPLLSESLHLRESKTKGVASSVRNKALLGKFKSKIYEPTSLTFCILFNVECFLGQL
tara:strand:- start:92 stop:496 length:405 start_codon:yes stop_codon:yes gene_type:complete